MFEHDIETLYKTFCNISIWCDLLTKIQQCTYKSIFIEALIKILI